jgi:intein/homing endonuclease
MHLPQNFAAKSGFPYLVDVKVSEFCPYNCQFCLTPETSILTEGGQKLFKDVRVGEKLYSFNEKTKEIEVDSVEEVSVRLVDEEIFDIELEDGRIISATKEHPFFVEGEWINTQDLQKDMSLHIF